MSNLLEGLNPAQKAAVTGFENPSLIIAGAGSGKTRVLTARIAYMLEKGVAPHSILALTFTNKAAAQMKERLAEMIDPYMARSIAMGTFHSIFSRIIRENAEALGYPTSYTIYQPSDAKSLIKSIVKELNLAEERYKPNVILSRISFAKNSLVTPSAYMANPDLAAEDRERHIPQFAAIYSTYCARCKASGALDFDDLLLQTNILFRDFPQILAKYQERFQYILVDEYQDTNYAQYIIIRRLAQYHGRVCVVGDDAQSIYSFRGAKIENILNFKKHFPTAQTYKLEQNYRSTQTIVDAANSLIAHNKTKLDKRCFSASERGENIRIVRAFTDRDEATMVADSMIERMQNESVSWGEMAVLYRTNSQSQAMEQALRQKNIPYQIHRGSSFYDHKEIKDILAYIRLVINPQDDEAFRRIINYPTRGIGGTTLDKIENYAKEQNSSMWNAIDSLVEEPTTDPIQKTIIRKVKEFVALIRDISLQRATMGLYDFGLMLASRSGILPAYRLQNSVEANSAIDNIEELLNTMQLFNEQVEAEIRNGERREDEPATIEEWLQSVMLLTDQDSGEEQGEKVTLMTVHSSKGLEYGYIFIIGVEHNLFPSQRALESGEIEEERRLFYVAITRAKKAAWISFCDMRFKWGSMEFSQPSSFIAEIDPKYLDIAEGTDLKELSSRRRSPAINDGDYITPKGERPNRERSSRGYISTTHPQKGDNREAINDLRRQYDIRHQQKAKRESLNTPPGGYTAPTYRSSTQPVAQPQRSTSGMRSLGVRKNPVETNAPSAKYSVGDRLQHEKFGNGRVIEIGAWSDGDMLKVDFESVGVKSIIAKLAPIKRL
ncbi:MAG: UvrD-helicase domain-containing protein [Rikenellaceae bacterium]